MLLPPARVLDTLSSRRRRWAVSVVRQVRRPGRVGSVHPGRGPVAERTAGGGEPERRVRDRHLQRGEPVRLPRRPLRRLRLHRQRRLSRSEPAVRLRAGVGRGLRRAAGRRGAGGDRPDEDAGHHPGAGGRGPGHLHRHRRRTDLRHHRQCRREAGHPAGTRAGHRRRGRSGVRRGLRPGRRRRPRHRGGLPVSARPGHAGGAGQGVLSADPGVDLPSAAVAGQRRRAEPEGAQRRSARRRRHAPPASTVPNVYTRAPQVAKFLVAGVARVRPRAVWCGRSATTSPPRRTPGSDNGPSRPPTVPPSSGPSRRPSAVARIAYGGDFNVFPRPDDPIAMSDSDTPSDQLRADLRRRRMVSLWDDLVAAVPSAAYSYTFQGQAQTLDNLFVSTVAARRPDRRSHCPRQRGLPGRLLR